MTDTTDLPNGQDKSVLHLHQNESGREVPLPDLDNSMESQFYGKFPRLSG